MKNLSLGFKPNFFLDFSRHFQFNRHYEEF